MHTIALEDAIRATGTFRDGVLRLMIVMMVANYNYDPVAEGPRRAGGKFERHTDLERGSRMRDGVAPKGAVRWLPKARRCGSRMRGGRVRPSPPTYLGLVRSASPATVPSLRAVSSEL